MAAMAMVERAAGAILGAWLSGSARTVLQTRELVFSDGVRARWLKPDIDRYLHSAGRIAGEIRTVPAPRAPSLGNRLMVEMTVRTIAAYRALAEAGVDPACARQVVADAVWSVYATVLQLYSLPFRLTARDPAKRIGRTIGALMRFPFDAPGAPGYAAQTWQANGDTYTHFTHCPPHSFVRAVAASNTGEGDLEAFRESWCRYDWPGADILAGDGKRGHYERRHTLSHGDAVCDMCWMAQAKQGEAPK